MSATYSSKSNARRAAKAAGIPENKVQLIEVDGRWSFAEAAETEALVALATEHADLGILPASKARDEAVKVANETGATVYLRDPMSDEVIDTVEPEEAVSVEDLDSSEHPVAQANKASWDAVTKGGRRGRAKAEKAPAEPKARKEAPSGMRAKIIELALRPEGVTPAELNELTEWKGAPWKWLFSNPKGTGFADRWGYKLSVVKNGRSASYRLERAA